MTPGNENCVSDSYKGEKCGPVRQSLKPVIINLYKIRVQVFLFCFLEKFFQRLKTVTQTKKEGFLACSRKNRSYSLTFCGYPDKRRRLWSTVGVVVLFFLLIYILFSKIKRLKIEFSQFWSSVSQSQAVRILGHHVQSGHFRRNSARGK